MSRRYLSSYLTEPDELNVSVTATCVGLTITTYAATVNAEVSITAETDALTLTTYDATVTFGYGVDCTSVSATLLTYDAAVKVDTGVIANVQALTLTSYAATLSEDIDISAGVVSLTLSEKSASVKLNVDVSTILDTLTLTERGATVSLDIGIAATCDSLIISEKKATVFADYFVDTNLAALSLVENAATVSFSINVKATCDTLTLTTKFAPVEWDSHAVIETGWQKDRGNGPWEFYKQPLKYGYVNNPRWVSKESATTFHKPCGYWPLVYTLPPYFQQSVAMNEDSMIVGCAAIAQDGTNYKLAFIDYNENVLLKEFNIVVDTSVNSYYGSVVVITTDEGTDRIIYVNFDGSDFCAYVWDYDSTPSKIVLDSSGNCFLSSIVYLGSGVVVAKDDIALKVHVSFDYGSTWTTYTTPSYESWGTAYGYPLLNDRNGRLYCIGSYLGDDLPFRAYYSDNYGATWVEIDHGLDDTYGDGSAGVYPSVDGDTIYIVKYADMMDPITYIFYSLNKGATWSVKAAPTIGGFGIVSYTVVAGIKDDVFILEGKLNDDPDYTPVYLRSIDHGDNWSAYKLPPYEVVPTVEKTAYWQFGITDNFWVRTFCGLYIYPNCELSYMVSIDEGASWMNRSLFVHAYETSYGPNPVWNMPGGTN